LITPCDRDPLVPVRHGIDCSLNIPGAVLKIVPGGHALSSGLCRSCSVR